ncbi:unnamed protein product [Somion occarium]|uniref:Uncharacterized protein n=1 Tax=Somion occarium TaxID=3059160 RepID=A0ABP1DDJ1_9APHY
MDVPRANEAKGSENFLPFPSTNTEILARGVTVLPFLPLAARSLMKMEESFETAISSLNPRHALLRRRSRVYMFIPPVPDIPRILFNLEWTMFTECMCLDYDGRTGQRYFQYNLRMVKMYHL